jgi:hypothetical protein
VVVILDHIEDLHELRVIAQAFQERDLPHS